MHGQPGMMAHFHIHTDSGVAPRDTKGHQGTGLQAAITARSRDLGWPSDGSNTGIPPNPRSIKHRLFPCQSDKGLMTILLLGGHHWQCPRFGDQAQARPMPSLLSYHSALC